MEPSELKNCHLKSTVFEGSIKNNPSAPTEILRSQTRRANSRQIAHVQRKIAVINNNEIIAAAAHFIKFNHF
jgi:hypothetical protein